MKKVKYQTAPVTYDNGKSPYEYEFTADEWFNLWVQYPAIKHNSWYNSLGNRTGHIFNRARATIEGSKNPVWSTARICPNIREFLTRCMVIRAPMDMHFARTEGHMVGHDGHDIAYYMETSDALWKPNAHHPIQFRSETNHTFHDHVNFKIETGIRLDLPKGMQCMFLQPFYDNPNAPFKVAQGLFVEPYNHNASLIVNWMINKNEVVDFIVKKGDALMYVYLPERVKFVEHNGRQGFIKTQFAKPKNLVTNEVKKKCPMVGK